MDLFKLALPNGSIEFALTPKDNHEFQYVVDLIKAFAKRVELRSIPMHLQKLSIDDFVGKALESLQCYNDRKPASWLQEVLSFNCDIYSIVKEDDGSEYSWPSDDFVEETLIYYTWRMSLFEMHLLIFILRDHSERIRLKRKTIPQYFYITQLILYLESVLRLTHQATLGSKDAVSAGDQSEAV